MKNDEKLRVLYFHAYYLHMGGECKVFENESSLMINDDKVQAQKIYFKNGDMKKISGVFIYLRFIFSYINVLISFRPHVVHFHNIFPFFLIAPVLARIFQAKTALTLHSYRFKCMNGLHFRNNKICEDCNFSVLNIKGLQGKCYSKNYFVNFSAWMYVHFFNFLLRSFFITRVIALSNFAKQRLEQANIRSAKILIKNNHLDLGNFDLGKKQETTRSNYLYIGRLSHEKGIMTLIDFWLKHPELDRLEIFGSGPQLNEVISRLKGAINISYNGVLENTEVGHKLRSAKALIFPSACFEVQPLILIEAMMNSIKIYASDAGAAPELLKGYHDYSLFSLSQIENLLPLISEDKKTDIPDLSFVQDRFSKSSSSKRLIEIYREMQLT